MINAIIVKSVRDFKLSIQLKIADGEVLVIVGPSGCGKTTTLDCLAGLTRPDQGSIDFGETVVFNADRNIHILPEKRQVGYVFQEYALFPHLTVHENVAYGLRARSVRSADLKAQVSEVLSRLHIESLALAYPDTLSGGERQRVALARAIAIKPHLLLLDEPMGALDAGTKHYVRRELKDFLSVLRATTILVTHDYEDALVLGDRILVMDQGKVVQCGTRQDLLFHPRSRFVADFTGVNYFEGKVKTTGTQPREISIGKECIYAATEVEGEVTVSFFPSVVILSVEQPHSSARNVFYGPILEVVHLGDRLRLHLDTPLPLVAELTAKAFEALDLAEGKNVYAFFKATAIRVIS